MTEIDLLRNNHLIDPQLHIWGWEIPVYLFLGGVTAGVMIFSALLAWRVPPQERSPWGRWLPFAAPVLLSLGMLALLLDLELKQHVYRFYTSFQVTSPMSWGSWILLAIYPVMLLLGVAELDERETKTLTQWAPLRVSRIGQLICWGQGLARSYLAALRWLSIVLGISLGAYTGVLLGTLGARPLWHSAVLAPLFLTSGFSTGAALLMLFPVTHREHQQLLRWDIGAILLELLLIALFLLGLFTGGASTQAAVSLFLGGSYTATFWALVVIGGLLVPLLIEGLEFARHLRPSYFAPFLLLVGGLSLRWILVAAGQG